MDGPMFTPFPVPVQPWLLERQEDGSMQMVGDVPLVTNADTMYRCSGCGTLVPPGVWITEAIRDGMIVGLSMRMGADGAHVHACGEGVPPSPPNT